ncbi:MAG: spermidine synthase [Verrucomicrobia bacterium]|nr:spermidine synthase [Verrucomicrobiota bacterium]MDA1067307.1 spermidine synthase [Verrucomicrobiota bacterium]
MIPAFQILDAQNTKLGALVLRRRTIAALDEVEVYEVKLGEEFLMSSLFPEAEKELAHLGLGKLSDGLWDVVVGGLGLGYTAVAALENRCVNSLVVVELFPQVIDWHRRGLLPVGSILWNDPRCRLIEQDFFAAAQDGSIGLDPHSPGKKFHAILLDIDHTPSHQLDQANAGFYSIAGLTAMTEQLHGGGVFGLWSDAAPDASFTEMLRSVFTAAEAIVVPFYNPILDKDSSNTVYLAVK